MEKTETERIAAPEEIVEGIRMAMSRGESLAKAKMSFINAGYNEGDINSAVSLLNPQEVNQAPVVQQPAETGAAPAIQEETPTAAAAPKTIQKVSRYEPEQHGPIAHSGALPKPKVEENPVQKVSNYEQPKKNSKSGFSRSMALVAVIVLIVLVGGLIGILLFKEQLIGLLS